MVEEGDMTAAGAGTGASIVTQATPENGRMVSEAGLQIPDLKFAISLSASASTSLLSHDS